MATALSAVSGSRQELVNVVVLAIRVPLHGLGEDGSVRKRVGLEATLRLRLELLRGLSYELLGNALEERLLASIVFDVRLATLAHTHGDSVELIEVVLVPVGSRRDRKRKRGQWRSVRKPLREREASAPIAKHALFRERRKQGRKGGCLVVWFRSCSPHVYPGDVPFLGRVPLGREEEAVAVALVRRVPGGVALEPAEHVRGLAVRGQGGSCLASQGRGSGNEAENSTAAHSLIDDESKAEVRRHTVLQFAQERSLLRVANTCVWFSGGRHLGLCCPGLGTICHFFTHLIVSVIAVVAARTGGSDECCPAILVRLLVL